MPKQAMPQAMPQVQTRTIRTRALYRSAAVSRELIDQQKRTVEVIFSTESPVQRWFGQEILDHAKASVDMKFLNSGRAPVLVSHDMREHVGVIESAEIGADRKGRALLRFGRSAKAEEIFQDVVDGIRGNISVGYVVRKMVLEEESEEKGEVYRVVDWRPFEASLVPAPADEDAHVGRKATTTEEFDTLIIDNRRQAPAVEDRIMPDPITPAQLEQVRTEEQANAQRMVDEANTAARNATATILAIGDDHGLQTEARQAIVDGKSPEEFQRMALDALAKRGLKPVDTSHNGELGLSQRDTQKYSVLKLLRHLVDPGNIQLREAAGFELECATAFTGIRKKDAQGVWIPPDAFKRDLEVGTPTQGAEFVGTELDGAGFIELLRNRMVLRRAGVQVLGDLVGNLALPRQTGAATAYWVTEGNAPAESQQGTGLVSLEPKQVAAYTEYTRRMMHQSSVDVENFVRMDLMSILSIALDRAGLHGASGGPTGVAATTGVGSVAGGTDGAQPTYDHILQLEEDAAVANADEMTLAYITNPQVRRILKKTMTNSTYGEIPLWAKGREKGMGEVNGYDAFCTNQVASNLSKGSASGICSAIFYGAWSQVIMGLWSGVDILVNPYALDTSGGVRITAFQDADVAIRQPSAFSIMLDALTP